MDFDDDEDDFEGVPGTSNVLVEEQKPKTLELDYIAFESTQ